MKVAVLIPNRPDGGRRDALLAWTHARLSELHPDFALSIGTHDADEGPFNRSAAINRAANAAPVADVLVIADSDSLVAADQLEAAISVAMATGQITFAYDRFAYLNRAMSDQVMAGYTGDWWPGVEWTLHGTCSSMVVVPRTLFVAVGGFDEGFVGWGMEDIGFSLSCQTFAGGMQRTPGDVWHLWHSPSVENNQESPQWQSNVARMKRYEACAYDKPAMIDLMAEIRP